MVEARADVFVEIPLALEVDLAGDLDRDAGVRRELNREMRVLLSVEAAEEADVVGGPGDDREKSRVLAVVDDADVLQFGAGSLLVPRDRDVVQVLPFQEVAELAEADLAVQSRDVRDVLEVEQVEAVRVDQIDSRQEVAELFARDAGDLVRLGPEGWKAASAVRELNRLLDDRYELTAGLRIAGC